VENIWAVTCNQVGLWINAQKHDSECDLFRAPPGKRFDNRQNEVELTSFNITFNSLFTIHVTIRPNTRHSQVIKDNFR
jgi:hypothetical protein